jgi:hypothetical protein
MEIIGKALVSQIAEIKGTKKPETYQGKIVDILEISESCNSFLVIGVNGLGMIDRKHIVAYFLCSVINGIVCPPKNNNFPLSELFSILQPGNFENNKLVVFKSLINGKFTPLNGDEQIQSVDSIYKSIEELSFKLFEKHAAEVN